METGPHIRASRHGGHVHRVRQRGFWVCRVPNSGFFVEHFIPERSRKEAFVFCRPLGHERGRTCRLFTELARAFAERGYDVLCIDYTHTGDSYAIPGDLTVSGQRQDVLDAVWFCRQYLRVVRVHLLGLRFGATLAAWVVEKCGAHMLIQLAPLLDPSRQLRLEYRARQLRRKLVGIDEPGQKCGQTSESFLDFHGYLLRPQFLQDLRRVRPEQAKQTAHRKVLVANLALSNRIPMGVRKLCDEYKARGCDARVTHIHCAPFWSHGALEGIEQVRNATVEWLSDAQAALARMNEPSEVSFPARERILCVDTLDNIAGSEQAVQIPVGVDGFIRGIWHEPSFTSAALPVGVLFVHGWVGDRGGSHDMFIGAARRLCASGYGCLRVDLRGRGASSGSWGDTSDETIWEDVRSAVDYIRARRGLSKVVVIAQCAGGRAAFGAHGVDGWIMWDAPPIDEGLRARLRRCVFLLRQCVVKAMIPINWWRLIIGQVNLRAIIRLLVKLLTIRPQQPQEPPQVNRMAARIPCLFVYGSLDPEAHAARQYYEWICRDNSFTCRFHLLPGTGHGFDSTESTDRLIRLTEAWLQEQFPSPAAR